VGTVDFRPTNAGLGGGFHRVLRHRSWGRPAWMSGHRGLTVCGLDVCVVLQVYVHYDLVVWSQTSWKWLEYKVRPSTHPSSRANESMRASLRITPESFFVLSGYTTT
jgi:hypothetical protein